MLDLPLHGEISSSKEVKEAFPHSSVSFRPQVAENGLQCQVFLAILFRLVQADSPVFRDLDCGGGYPAVLLQIKVIDFINGPVQLLHGGALGGRSDRYVVAE